jgi:hypothetical protein
MGGVASRANVLRQIVRSAVMRWLCGVDGLSAYTNFFRDREAGRRFLYWCVLDLEGLSRIAF